MAILTQKCIGMTSQKKKKKGFKLKEGFLS